MDLLGKIKNAGIVGCGGAGFPTHVKLDAKPEYFIINGAECEPLLHTDRYIMTHLADRLIAGADAVCRALSVREGYIALKKSYQQEISALQAAIEKAGSCMKIHEMDSFYPAGDEQVIVYEVTGRVVPPAGIPLNVGVVVDNAATVLAIADAANDIPFTDKYLTVTGEVNEPAVLKVPVGTSFRECIRLAGGVSCSRPMVVSGGPMMGKPLSWEEAMGNAVTKTTSGILILKDSSVIGRNRDMEIRHMLNRAKSACIQCSFCTSLCPRHLLGHPLKPHRIMRKMAAAGDPDVLLADEEIRQAAICCECGICEVYACPMGLNPRKINSLLKAKLAQAGIRYERTQEEYCADPGREYRKCPTKRVAARAGVLPYYGIQDFAYREFEPERVEIPLKMNIGAEAVPVVGQGSQVKKGQRIAACPDGKLGADIHASIAGTVSFGQHSVTIDRTDGR